MNPNSLAFVFIGFPVLILNEPKYMGNVGMVCRLISNFNLEPLRILGKPFKRNLEMEWMAHGAQEELEKIQFFENFWDCTKDLELTIGTGIVHGRDRAQFIDFSMLKEKIRNKRFGIIFGREDTGIQKKVSELCDYMLDFDLKGSQKSMNLAQAVAYFLGRIAVEFEQAKIETIKDINIQKKDLLKYIQEVFSILEMNDFHGSENLATKRFRSLLRFPELTQGDINFLFKMLKAIENKIKYNSANEE